MKDTSKRSKTDNPIWQKTVKRINELLSPCYDEYTKTVELNRIPNTPEGVKILEELRKLYDTLDNIRSSKKSAKAKKFIKEFLVRSFTFISPKIYCYLIDTLSFLLNWNT